MKYRILSALLALLLLAAVPMEALGAEKIPDFTAIREAGEGPLDEVLIINESMGEIPFQDTLSCGIYFAYKNPKTGYYGLADVYGKIYWEIPGEIQEVYYNGYCLVGDKFSNNCRLYNRNGKRVSDERLPYPMYELTDQVTGEQKWIGSNTLAEHGIVYRGMIVGYDGTIIYANMMGDIYHGMVAYEDMGTEKWGIQKLDGTVVLAPTYEYLAFLDENTLICQQDGLFGGIRPDGTKVFDCRYTDFSRLGLQGKDRIIVQKDGKWGVINFAGSTVVPFDYDEILSTRLGQTSLIGEEMDKSRFPYRVTKGEMEYNYAEDEAYAYCGSRETPLEVCWVRENTWIVKEDGSSANWRLTDSQGRSRISGTADKIEVSPNGYLFANYNQSGKSRFYGNSLQLVWEMTGTECSFVHDLVIFTKQNEDQSTSLEVYSLGGELIRSVMADSFAILTPSSIALYRDGKSALMKRDGSVITDFCYLYFLSCFQEMREPVNLISLVREDRTQQLFDTGTWRAPLPENAEAFYWSPSRFYNYKIGDRQGLFYWRRPNEAPFLDTSVSAWYTDAVRFCAAAGLMNGTGNGKFEPKKQMTRAMLVQVLYNVAGEKTPPQGFTDVPDGKWYTDAVNWAASKGIVNGVTSTQFQPNACVTREQMVTILQRFAQKYTTAVGDPKVLNAFTDTGAISAYAKGAMAWAVEQGILTGKTATTLDPKGNATRAEIATVLMRFIRLMAEA